MTTKEPTSADVQAELWAICNRAVDKLEKKGNQRRLALDGAAEEDTVATDVKAKTADAMWAACRPVASPLYDVPQPSLRLLDVVRHWVPHGKADIVADTIVVRAFAPDGRLMAVCPEDGPFPRTAILTDGIGEAFLRRRIPWSTHPETLDGALVSPMPYSHLRYVAVCQPTIRSLVRACYRSLRLASLETYGGLPVLCAPDLSALEAVYWPEGIKLVTHPDLAPVLANLKVPPAEVPG